MEVWSDASGLWGCGALWEGKWFQVSWERCPEFLSAPIAAKELLPILVASAIWGEHWRGLTILCHCDNQAVVETLKGGYCKEKGMAHLLRCLFFFLEARYNFKLLSVHIPGCQNKAADAISRNKLDNFFLIVPQADQMPCSVPVGILSSLVGHDNWTYGDWMSWLGSMSGNQ